MNQSRIAILTLTALAVFSLSACSRPGSAYVGTWVGPHRDVEIITRHGGLFAIRQQGHGSTNYYHQDTQGDLTDGVVIASIDRTGDLILHSPFGSETMHRGHRLSPAALRAVQARRKAQQAKAAPMPPL